MGHPILVYCAHGNRRFADIAVAAGYRYGAQLPNTVYHPPYMADQNWKKPNRPAYMTALAQHRPTIATVLDWEREDQLPDVLSWAEEAAQYVERVMVVPKVIGGISRIPRRVGGKDVVLAYSVLTRFGGSQVPLWELAGWPVHLLGGSPNAQKHIYLTLRGIAEVVSTDGNYAQKMAVCYGQFYDPTGSPRYRTRWWPKLAEADGERREIDMPYECFRRSCENIMTAWASLDSRQG